MTDTDRHITDYDRHSTDDADISERMGEQPVRGQGYTTTPNPAGTTSTVTASPAATGRSGSPPP